jgi:hypothetical protein
MAANMRPLASILPAGGNPRSLEAYAEYKRRKSEEKQPTTVAAEPPPPQAGVPLPPGPSSHVPFGEVSTKSLEVAIRDAMKHHLSLSLKDRIANSKRAKEALGEHLTRTKSGKVKDLMLTNGKLEKTQKGSEGREPLKITDPNTGKERGVEAWGVALSPAYGEGKFNLCPNRFACEDICLGKTSGQNFAGGGGKDLAAVKGPRLAGRRRTLALFRNPKDYAIKLNDEIESHKRLAERHDNHLGVRLNILSDIPGRVYKPIIENHKDVSFYDYTKLKQKPVAPNHFLTRSSTGLSQTVNGEYIHNPYQNWREMRKHLDEGGNVAMAFSDKDHLPTHIFDKETGKNYPILNGDEHDFRPIDKKGHIVALKNKMVQDKAREATKKHRGFFVDYDPKVMRDKKGKLIRHPSPGVDPKTGKAIPGDSIPTVHHVEIPVQPHVKDLYDNDGNVVPRELPPGMTREEPMGAYPGYERELRHKR